MMEFSFEKHLLKVKCDQRNCGISAGTFSKEFYSLISILILDYCVVLY